ncbi:hypothetical protein VTK26DRAFT_3828 [Humicola hyalothermophila]
MSETTPASSQGPSHRARGGRRGRPRRGHHNGPRRPNAAQGGSDAAQSQQVASANVADTVAAVIGGTGGTPRLRDGQPGESRAERGRSGAGRRGRGGASQRSVVVSHRGGRRPPTSSLGGSSSSLRAGAPEFVPGQPVPARISEAQATAPSPRPQPPSPIVTVKSSAADLPTRIHEDIENRQYECVMCTNEVLRNSKVWSCAICWTVTHIGCVRKWYANQLKERAENQGPNQPEGWRCPGCNSTLIDPPGPYHCWCGKEIDPKPIPGLPPHSCGQSCSKPRATCPHQCPLTCHAGPCPPCTLMGPTQPCFCGKNTSTKRCSETDYEKGWSCQEPCGDLLPCGEHACTQPCHAGLCGACEIPVASICYCGKERREIPCDQRDEVLESFDYRRLGLSGTPSDTEFSSDEWFEGSFRCTSVCGRSFDCGQHACQKLCHPQDETAAHCPFSPDVVTHCPCGKTPLESMPVEPRQSCQDPVPRCDKPCNKVLACGHLCLDKCHTGACAPCTQKADISCRCGRTIVTSACHQGEIVHPHCFRVCRAQLNCGRHECGEHCCSGEKKAAERRKQKRSANENYEPEHICLQICGRQLKCGKHTCQQLCHRGPCMSCLEAIFDDISCPCGRTVLQPPQPCGTRPPECRFPCTRPRSCGHPTLNHQCHSDETPCPKCPYLVERVCICGKKTLKNQPCWFEEARCGLPCGKKLKCGAHECRKPCHKPGECEDIGISGSRCCQPCGKTRKSCEHTCVDECHAPYPCKEDKPCQSKTFITCPCQNRKQEVRCLATKLNPAGSRESALKCDDECLRLQRNRKLAEALDIDPETHTDDHIPYSDTTLRLYRENINWAQTQEREFRVFAAGDEKRLRFKPMPLHQRAFLHALAEDFGLDSESEDPEPHRHVCLYKTPRFVSAPRKTLAQCLRIAQSAAHLNAGASSLRAPAPAAPRQPQDIHQAFNAFLLKEPRFGLTIDELDQALAPDLAFASRPGSGGGGGPALAFSTTFLPSEEIVIKATPNLSTAAVATASASATTPQAVESALSVLKPAVARTVTRLGLARAVSLCHADASLSVTRREGDGSPAAAGAGAKDAGGWSAVASRGSWRKAGANRAQSSAAAAAASIPRAPSAFVALRRLELRKKEAMKEKEKEEEQVEEDWLTAAEKLVGEEAAAGEREEERQVDGVENDSGGKEEEEGVNREVNGVLGDDGEGDRRSEGATAEDPQASADVAEAGAHVVGH